MIEQIFNGVLGFFNELIETGSTAAEGFVGTGSAAAEGVRHDHRLLSATSRSLDRPPAASR